MVEQGLTELIEKNVAAGRLKATLSCEDAVMNSDMSLICVGTPSKTDGSLDLTHVVSACENIGKVLKHKNAFHSIVLRSTVVPGTSRNVAIPTLEKASAKTAGIDFCFANNPEFLRESQAIADYFNPPKIVIAALNERTTTALCQLYDGMTAPKIITDFEVAEAVKYADNAWHATKVAFSNELGSILKTLDVDSHKVMDIFCLDRKLNISEAYLKPGFAFGGSCLPKDVRALRACGQAKGVKTPFFDAVLTANEEQIRRGFDMVVRSGKRKVVLMGLSFKAGSDDLRESPLVTLADMLIRHDIDLKIYDPAVRTVANNSSLQEKLPHISKCLVETPEDLTTDSEIFIIGNHGHDYADILLKQANDNAQIIDLVRLKNGIDETCDRYEGICW
jgi:GDP-mannose 6-dehydrogenase